MLTVYFNYPNSYISIHGDRYCGEIPDDPKPNHREVDIDLSNVDDELERLYQHPFGSTVAKNDMWVRVNFGDEAAEKAIINKIQKILGRRYKPFREPEISRHC